LPVLYTLAPTGEPRDNRRASEVTYVIVKARYCAGDRGGQGGDEQNNAQADLEYLRILHLAAGDGEAVVREALSQLLCGAVPLSYEAVRGLVRGERTSGGVPCLNISAPDLSVYDRLLGFNTAEAVCA
jgi:hypothetical protein